MSTNSPPRVGFKRLPFVYLLIPLVLGILGCFWFPQLWSTGLAYTGAFVFFGLSAIILLKKPTGSLLRKIQVGSLFACLFFCGILFSRQSDIRYQKGWYGNYQNNASAFVGRVTEPAEQKAKTIQVLLTVQKTRINNQWQNSSGQLLLYLYQQDSMPQIKVGDQLLLPNKLVDIKPRGNPFEFNYAEYLHRRGLYFQSFLSFGDIEILRGKQHQPKLINRLRNHLHKAIQENIKDRPTKALTQAILLNDRSLLTNNIRKAYSITGIAHIIAISGMHVSLFFSILLIFLWWLKAPRFKWVKYLLALPVIWLYIALTNFPASAVRAGVMFTLLFLGLAFRKQQNPLNLLAATAFILLCLRPQWLFDTGVQLSFMAVASILIFFRPISNLWQPKAKIALALWQTISVSLSVQVLIFPFILYYFHQFPLWFLVANIPAAVFALLLMVMALLLFILTAVGIPCLWLGEIMAVMTHLFHDFIFFLAKLTPGSLLHLYITPTEFWLLLLGIIGISLFIFFKKSIYAITGLSLFCLLGFSFIYNEFQSINQKRIVVYNSTPNSVIDFFLGKKHYSLGITEEKQSKELQQYVLIPSRLGFGAMESSENKQTRFTLMIQGKRILILNQSLPSKITSSFPIDYLIISHNCKLRPEEWKTIFHPRKIILDSSFPRFQAKKWQQILKDSGLSTHNVQTDGAWVFPKD